MNRPEPALVRECEAALAFWQAAGVDCDFTDDATAWLAQAPIEAPAALPAAARSQPRGADDKASSRTDRSEKAAPPPSPHVPSRRDLLGESPPGDLESFRRWWTSAPQLDTARLYPRIPPRGPAGAGLMVLVPQPEEGDRERLLEGPQGRLLANMLGAMGLEESAVYIAAALPGHTPMADLAALAKSGMDAVTAHHVALAAPERLLLLGTALPAMLAGRADDGLREFNHNGRKVPVMVSETLEAMTGVPKLKARFWRRWMEWSAST
ncbi:hypothetical protein [Erythrobacter dokdonensis]|uniref:Uracil DNA glycosylase superfamily protein n=1 Tax=Erythrobacter dokdonensis DSW-74 TaxID=1300349 RepID=A0A1A7BIS6_9SPHN|nr:hypothetical protein [Erythrobacter dokdonensis]OBV12458.1 Uracil DNA glycosylase superfamily protein [Erythrobacter dokdonensis DSW-74]